ncbi:MAG: DUF1848 domain-containing protein [Synergistaceae bacterium]|nr:DUF1848 domain-containing protein [Synergistaceae bacterium]
MIVSASRRTDIPAFYSEWLMNRLREGFVLVPNPRNPKRLTEVSLSPENVDCIVFWSKNPAPMLGKLAEIERMGHRFHFSFTLTPYGRDAEPGVPPVDERLDTFVKLSDLLGPDRVDWRYDPVMTDGRFMMGCSPLSFHRERFGALCAALAGRTERCIVSFVDVYAHLRKRIAPMDGTEIRALAEILSDTARRFGIPLFACAEATDFSEFGIGRSSCIDGAKIGRIVGHPVRTAKDRGQRKECRCVESVDIGTYDTCLHGCVYCYATTSPAAVTRRVGPHDPTSPLLVGRP